jgi:hypothetical protein
LANQIPPGHEAEAQGKIKMCCKETWPPEVFVAMAVQREGARIAEENCKKLATEAERLEVTKPERGRV